MRAELVYSPAALDDLDQIWEWVAVEHGEPKAADRIVTDILDRMEMVAEFPMSTPALDSMCQIRSDWRTVNEKGYIAFFRVRDERLYVDRILSGKSDYLRELFGVQDGTHLYG